MNLPRTRTLVIGISSFILLVVAYFSLIVGPLEDEISSLQKTLDSDTKRLQLLTTLKAEQQRLAQIMRAARAQQQASSTSLLSNVEGIVKRLGLSDKTIKMSPMPVGQTVRNATEEKLQIRFVTLTFKKILRFLNEIEALPSNVRIESLDIRKTGTSATMTLVISSLLFGTGK